jgi:UDPglucose--hexose-1-phosphate uridylyltransferase
MKSIYTLPHRRYNALTGEWVLVSPHRAQRPWLGKVEDRIREDRPAYDPDCYLCPGNQRVSGAVNPAYEHTYVFTNDFQALLPDGADPSVEDGGLLRSAGVRGTCRVVCFSPRHDLTLAEMDVQTIRSVIDCWAEQSADLGQTYRWVQVFENKGEMMGASNPHPHGQIWALDALPNEPLKEDANQRVYSEGSGRVLLLDCLQEELETRERVVVENEAWVALVPYWAIWPFETMVVPKRHVLRLPDLSHDERNLLAQVMKSLLLRYDSLFNVSFPYSMGWHGAPFDEQPNDHWQLHAHYYPPLLRSATVRKFLVGFEMLAEAQRDLTAETAAERLRTLEIAT